MELYSTEHIWIEKFIVIVSEVLFNFEIRIL